MIQWQLFLWLDGFLQFYMIRENSAPVAICTAFSVVFWVIEDWDSKLWTVIVYTKNLQETE